MIKDMLINMIMEHHIIPGGIITFVIQVGRIHFMMKVGMILVWTNINPHHNLSNKNLGQNLLNDI